MPDRRRLDDISTAELESILLERRRDERIAQFHGTGILDRGSKAPKKRRNPGITQASLPEVPEVYSYADEISALSGGFSRADSRNPHDKVLLAVEYLAVAGLLGILLFTFFNVRSLNRRLAEQQADLVSQLPTVEPTPLFRTVVLPGGHTPPTAPEGARPNYDEVPSELRPIVEMQFAGPVIVPTPGPSNAIRIKIPAIDVDAAIVQGDGWEQLKKGVGQHLGSSDPGYRGNLVLSAHNDIFGQIFRDLDSLQPGDEIIIYTQAAEYIYIVREISTVKPTAIEVLEQGDKLQVTLISCYPYLVNTERIVVVGELQNP